MPSKLVNIRVQYNANNGFKPINQLKIYFDIIPKLAINFMSRRNKAHTQPYEYEHEPEYEKNDLNLENVFWCPHNTDNCERS